MVKNDALCLVWVKLRRVTYSVNKEDREFDELGVISACVQDSMRYVIQSTGNVNILYFSITFLIAEINRRLNFCLERLHFVRYTHKCIFKGSVGLLRYALQKETEKVISELFYLSLHVFLFTNIWKVFIHQPRNLFGNIHYKQ